MLFDLLFRTPKLFLFSLSKEPWTLSEKSNVGYNATCANRMLVFNYTVSKNIINKSIYAVSYTHLDVYKRQAIDNTTAKFFPIFMGPYRIEKQIARYTYMLKDVEKNKIIGKYHGDSLRKYKQNIDPLIYNCFESILIIIINFI